MKPCLLALALAVSARAQTPSTAPAAEVAASTGPLRTGWVTEANSLLHYGPDGKLDNEVGLGRSEEAAGSRVSVHEIRAGAAPSGRFAWLWESQTVRDALRSTMLESRRLLRLLGSEGRELWRDAEADRPTRGEPVVFSSDGETLVLARRTAKGWFASVRSYTGVPFADLGPYPRLEAIALSPNGKYALARWLIPDQSATHTFYQVVTQIKKDIPSSEFYLGYARVTDDGKIYSGKKLVLDFEPPDILTIPTQIQKVSTVPAFAPAPEAPPFPSPQP